LEALHYSHTHVTFIKKEIWKHAGSKIILTHCAWAIKYRKIHGIGIISEKSYAMIKKYSIATKKHGEYYYWRNVAEPFYDTAKSEHHSHL
jgi:hypothetical protein